MPKRGDELSLRHLPDVSDTSFSFQIPGNGQTENLLAEENLSFADDFSTGTPLISRPTFTNRPVTRSQLTPKPALKILTSRPSSTKPSSSFPKFSYHDSDDTNPRLEKPSRGAEINNPHSSRPKLFAPSLQHLPPSEASTASRAAVLVREDVNANALNEDLNTRPSMDQDLGATNDRNPKGITETVLEKKPSSSRAERRERRIARAKEKTVIEGGITKTRATSSSSSKPVDASSRPDDAAAISATLPKYKYSSLRHIPLLEESAKGDDSVSDSFDAQAQGGGAAARLVQYSQTQNMKLINSFGLLTSDNMPLSLPLPLPLGGTNDQHTLRGSHVPPPKSHPGTQQREKEGEGETPTQSDSDRDRPLTLSQLSPRKQHASAPPAPESDPAPEPEPKVETAPTPPAKSPMAPLRSSTKRPACDAADEAHPHAKKKRPEKDALDAEGPVAAATRTRASALTGTRGAAKARQAPAPVGRARTGLNDSGASASSTSTSSAKAKVAERDSARTKATRRTVVARDASARPALQDGKSKENAPASAGASSSTAEPRITTTARSLHPTHSIANSTSTNSLRTKNAAAAPSSSASASTSKPPFYVSLSGESEPQTHTEVRRRGQAAAEGSTGADAQRLPQRPRLPIPDFKSMHATQEAKLTRLKESLHPTVPRPIEWETAHRARSRAAFDAVLKEKERERAEAAEEERKAREEEEEREVREMRRRAVPRAHEVPGWYRDAPRREAKREARGGD